MTVAPFGVAGMGHIQYLRQRSLPPDMLLTRGSAGGTTLTGTLYEEGDRAPPKQGAPKEGTPTSPIAMRSMIQNSRRR